MYKIKGEMILKKDENILIPKDEKNRHYQEYLKWLKLGNKPEPEYTEEELLKLKWAEIRLKRNELLQKTDIYMLVDKYETLTDEQKKELKIYRQKLRDIPQEFKSSEDVKFPKVPDFIGGFKIDSA